MGMTRVRVPLGPPSVEEARAEAEREIEVGLIELLDAFRKVLREAEAADRRHEVTTEIISVRERMIAVMDALASREAVEFDQIFRTSSNTSASRRLPKTSRPRI